MRIIMRMECVETAIIIEVGGKSLQLLVGIRIGFYTQRVCAKIAILAYITKQKHDKDNKIGKEF